MSKHVPTYPFRPLAGLHLSAGAVLLAATAACLPGTEIDAEPEAPGAPAWADELGNVDLSPVNPASDQWNACPTWDCGKNHAMLNTFPVPAMREDGQDNGEGFSIVWFKNHQGVPLDLDVEDGLIRGHEGATMHSGASLLGSQMKVTNGQTNWYIRIHDMTYSLAYWDGKGVVPAYHLQYYREGEQLPGVELPWKDLCNEPLEPADDLLFLDAYETYAILIDDERYDTGAKKVREEVVSGDAEGWFNIACAGSALSKMMLLHFNPHLPDIAAIPSPFDYYTTQDQRTATLKMLTADYLGIGEAFTRGGQPLRWEDANGWNSTACAADTLEAVWDENGAVCLNVPRMVGEPSDPNHSTSPLLTAVDIFASLADKCASYNETKPVSALPCEVPPPCSEVDLSLVSWVWMSYAP